MYLPSFKNTKKQNYKKKMSAELKYEQKRLDEHAENADKNQRAREELFDTVAECVEVLSHLDYQQVRSYLDENLPDEKQQIIDEFNKAFKDVPKDNALRIKTLEVMGLLGITIYTPQEQYPEFQEEEEEEVVEENSYLTMKELGGAVKLAVEV